MCSSSYRNVQRFRGGLVFQAHRLLYHSTLGPREKKKRREEDGLSSRQLTREGSSVQLKYHLNFIQHSNHSNFIPLIIRIYSIYYHTNLIQNIIQQVELSEEGESLSDSPQERSGTEEGEEDGSLGATLPHRLNIDICQAVGLPLSHRYVPPPYRLTSHIRNSRTLQ